MRENRVPWCCRISAGYGTGDAIASSSGISDRQPEVHVASWLQSPEEDHVGLAHGVVTCARECLDADV